MHDHNYELIRVCRLEVLLLRRILSVSKAKRLTVHGGRLFVNTGDNEPHHFLLIIQSPELGMAIA